MAQGGRSIAGLNEVLPTAVWLQVWCCFFSSGTAGFRCVSMAVKKNKQIIFQHSPEGVKLGFGGIIYGIVGSRGSTSTGDSGVHPCHSFLTL